MLFAFFFNKQLNRGKMKTGKKLAGECSAMRAWNGIYPNKEGRQNFLGVFQEFSLPIQGFCMATRKRAMACIL